MLHTCPQHTTCRHLVIRHRNQLSEDVAQTGQNVSRMQAYTFTIALSANWKASSMQVHTLLHLQLTANPAQSRLFQLPIG
jgi:hypothetical protein